MRAEKPECATSKYLIVLWGVLKSAAARWHPIGNLCFRFTNPNTILIVTIYEWIFCTWTGVNANKIFKSGFSNIFQLRFTKRCLPCFWFTRPNRREGFLLALTVNKELKLKRYHQTHYLLILCLLFISWTSRAVLAPVRRLQQHCTLSTVFAVCMHVCVPVGLSSSPLCPVPQFETC